MKRTVFFISDGTGITAESFGQSLLAQFEEIEFEHVTLPYTDTLEKAEAVVAEIDRFVETESIKPLIFSTIIDLQIRRVISQSKAMMMDIFQSYLGPLEDELHTNSTQLIGKKRAIVDDSKYNKRIEAVHYALDNDDGARTRHYDKADIILIGVSRCGKTPTCLYLALQFGIRAANYPITEEDLEHGSGLPKALKPYLHKVFGLTIDVDRLAAIRHERKANSRYSSVQQCTYEVHEVEKRMRQEDVTYINTTHHSIEEIATKMIAQTGIERRLK